MPLLAKQKLYDLFGRGSRSLAAKAKAPPLPNSPLAAGCGEWGEDFSPKLLSLKSYSPTSELVGVSKLNDLPARGGSIASATQPQTQTLPLSLDRPAGQDRH